MSRLNGVWWFFYSEEQAKDRESASFVRTKDGFKQYTEAVHLINMGSKDYIHHKDRFEDSTTICRKENPEIKRGQFVDE